MPVALQPHVRAAPVGDDLVLLDVRRDAYLCLPDAAGAWRALVRGRETAAATALARRLVGAGLATPAPAALAADSAEALVTPCRRIPAGDASPRARDAIRLGLAYWDLLRRYRGRRFEAVLAFVRARGRASAPADAAELARLCAVFERAAVWLPLSSKCLERSFLLLRFLQRSGCDARWRFGVRLWPFAAHCWLQAGELALDDWPERLVGFVPLHDA